MMLDRRHFCAAAAAGLAAPVLAARAKPGGYAFTYFHNADNGGAGMRLAISEDGWRYRPVRGAAPMLMPEVGENKLMRDPCVARDPRTGLFHMVWTTGWTGVTIGHASSPDLVHWSPQRALPVMAAFPGTRNAWAPELVWDDRRRHFLIVWSSTVGAAGKEGDHRLYATTTRDFVQLAPTFKFYDPGFSVIDATFLRHGGRTTMFVKDERKAPLRKVIQSCDVTLSPPHFGALSAPITPAWSEGPTAVVVDGEILLFFDRYTEKHYDAVASADGGRTWRDVSDRIAIPAGANHGTILPIARATFEALAALG